MDSAAGVSSGLASLKLNEAPSPYNSGSHMTSSSGGVASSSAPGAHSDSGETVEKAAARVQHTFGELLAVMSPMQLLGGDDAGAEAEHWSVFADVFEKEVRHQEVAGGCELDLEQRRQILADILVWAEVTRSQYDSSTASFVTEPHEQDASFRRIGDLLKEAKQSHGLCQ